MLSCSKEWCQTKKKKEKKNQPNTGFCITQERYHKKQTLFEPSGARRKNNNKQTKQKTNKQTNKPLVRVVSRKGNATLNL